MTKKLAKRNLISVAILAVIMIVLCIVNIAVPSTNYRFVGFANAITSDIDMVGGYSGEFSIGFKSGEIDKSYKLNKAVNLINQKFKDFGYGNSVATVSGLDTMYVEIAKIGQATTVLDTIETDGELSLRTSETAGDDDLMGDDIKDITATFGQTDIAEFAWGITIQLSDEGLEKIKTMTAAEEGAEASGTMYIYVGDEQYSKFSYQSQITNSSFFISGSTDTQENANIYAFGLLMAKTGIEFTKISEDYTEIAPILGENTVLFSLIAVAVIMILFMALMVYLFGELGWLLLLGLALLVTITIFFMQAIPIYILSFSGIIGGILGLVMFFVSNINIYSNIKKGYAEGKKIPLAVKTGFSKSVMPVVDMNVLTFILAVFIYFFGGIYAQSFAFTLGLVVGLNLLITLVLNRVFANWYTTLNSTKANKLHFKREANINELN